jgi:hypothetical protein
MLCSLIVLGSLAFSLTYYRNDLRQLLRMFFLTAVLIGALLALRHSLGRARRRLGKWLSRAKEESKETVVEERPDLDRARDEALARAQRLHDEKAEDYESRVAGPRRVRKLEKNERKSIYFRGFGAHEGRTLGEASGGAGAGSCDQGAESRDGHVTDDDVIGEGDRSGRKVWLAVQLPTRTLRSQFHISQTMKVVYSWLEEEGEVLPGQVLITPHPRQLLDDRGRTLEDYGITMDTKLFLEELDD